MLYIHIPFCDSKCHYCAFNSFTTNHHLKEAYLKALLEQLLFDIERFGIRSFRTIFIGGGTPSTLSLQSYEKLFKALQPYMSQTKEVTIEANPSAKKEWIEGIKDFATRISFGVQSFDESKLRFLGRAHTPKMAIDAIEIAFKAGFSHISLDLIYDCACDSYELLQRDIQTTLLLPIDHLSAYALTLEEGTPFFGKEEVKKNEEGFGYFIKEQLQEQLPQYEVSNFGNPSLHNLGYWRLQNYLGVGCGAVGFFEHMRYYPHTNLHHYIQNPLYRQEERLSKEDLRMERIFLGMRSQVGVAKSLVDKERASLLLQEKKLYEKKDRLYNPNYFLADELALFLL